MPYLIALITDLIITVTFLTNQLQFIHTTLTERFTAAYGTFEYHVFECMDSDNYSLSVIDIILKTQSP